MDGGSGGRKTRGGLEQRGLGTMVAGPLRDFVISCRSAENGQIEVLYAAVYEVSGLNSDGE